MMVGCTMADEPASQMSENFRPAQQSDADEASDIAGEEHWFGRRVGPGERVNTELVISESFSSRSVSVPIHIRRGHRAGPTVFVTAALHGDELNGAGAVHTLLCDPSWELTAGTLLMVPVLNVLGFERHSRYLPDRRDLNRCFPGTGSGSMATRMAAVIFQSLVKQCDYGIDLHTAAVRRTNYPNVRADMQNTKCVWLAEAFGAGIILHGKGPSGSLRREATKAGCPTIVVEGGEVWKFEPSVLECMTRGVFNVLKRLQMMEGEPLIPEAQSIIRKTKWIRAERGGFLSMHVAPGDVVVEGQALASGSNLLGEDQNRLEAPFAGIIIGMTSLPAVQPGEPVVHIGRLPSRKSVRKHQRQASEDVVQRTLQEHLATGIHVVDPTEPREL